MSLLESILEDAQGESHGDPDFPHAPEDWSPDLARQGARQEKLNLTGQHWDVIRALQAYWAQRQDEPVHRRELHDALEERFHAQGGVKHLYLLFPQGPVAQGCRLAGLKAPAGATDKGFGSVA